MADTKTSDEAAATTPTGAELVRITQGGSSKRTTAAVLGHQFRGAKAQMTSDDTAVNLTTTAAISFDVARFDTDSFWSAGSPARLTIQAGKGIKYVSLTGQVSLADVTSGAFAAGFIVHRNSAGTALDQWANDQMDFGGNAPRLNVSSGPVAVSDGDYFELLARVESDTSATLKGAGTSLVCGLTLHVIGMEPV